MLLIYLFFALLIAACAWLIPRKPKAPFDAGTGVSMGPERRHPEKHLKDQDPIAERRKDDDVGGEGG
jgi:hypothetical protein